MWPWDRQNGRTLGGKVVFDGISYIKSLNLDFGSPEFRWSCAVLLLVDHLDIPHTTTLSSPDSACALRAYMMFSVSFFFPLCSFLFFVFFCPVLPIFALVRITVISSPLFRVYAYAAAVFLVLSRINWYGNVYDKSLWCRSLCVPVLQCTYCFVAFFHRDVYCCLFCNHGLDFRKMS